MTRRFLLGLTVTLLVVSLSSLAAPAVPTVAGAGWQPVTTPTGGSVRALALSPAYTEDPTVFAGISGEGIYHSGNGGLTWTATAAGPWAIIDLAISPAFAADASLFALEGVFGAGYKVHKSTDAGDSWQEVGSAANGVALAISPDFATDGTLYLLTGSGNTTYISEDGGNTFTAAAGWFGEHNVVDLAFSPDYAADETIFAAVPGDGLYRSDDGGANWSATALGGDVRAVATSPEYAADAMVLAIMNGGEVYRSLDGGSSWEEVWKVGSGGRFSIAFSPTFAADQLVMVASSVDPGAYRSVDGGDSWTQSGWYGPTSYQGFVGGNVQALALAPTTAFGASGFAGTNSFLYHTYNYGENWSAVRNTLSRLTVRSLAIAPGRPNWMLTGTSYFDVPRADSGTLNEWNGNLQLSTNGGETWRDVSGALQQIHEVAFSPDFAGDGTAFATSGTVGQHGFVAGGVYRSQDGGQNWQSVLDGFAYSGLAFSPDYVADKTLWVAATTYQLPKGIYVSEDGGDSWRQLVDGLNVSLIVPSPNYRQDRTLFAGGSNLYKSANGGATWSQVLAGPVTALAISPAYGASRTLYAATQTPGNPGALFRSADGGATWQEVDTGMLAYRDGKLITVSTLDFAVDGSILAGIHYGDLADAASLFRSVDGGSSWTPVAGGLAASALHAVHTRPAGSMLFYTGTGRGLWQLHLPQGGLGEPGQWRSSGPRGGKAHALAVSPAFADDGIAFSGEWLTSFQSTQSGMGVLKSTDEGQSWYRPETGMESVAYSSAIHNYAFSPNFADDDTVFVATWGGLFKSVDEGESWEWLAGAYDGPPGAYTTIAVAPDYASSGLVLAGNWGSLLRSDDGGETWQRNDAVSASGEIAFSPAFAADQTIFAAGGTLHRSLDGGAKWQTVLTDTLSLVKVSPAFAGDGTVFAAGSSTFYRSTDGGTSWISSTITAEAPRIEAVAVSPAFDGTGSLYNTVFAGTLDGLFRSDDAGQSWQEVAAYKGEPIRSLAFSPGWPAHRVLLVGTPAGVYRYLGPETPRQSTQGFLPLTIDSLAWSAEANLMLAGTIDHGVYGSEDGGTHWLPYGQQLGSTYYGYNNVAISPDYADDHTLFASYLSRTGIGGSVYRSQDSGANWERVYGLDYIGDIEFSPAFATDNTVFASSGERHVVRSTSGGDEDSWVELGTWPNNVQRGAALEIELPPNYPDDGTVFAAGSDGFWRLPAGAGAWIPATSGIERGMYVSDLEISPDYEADQTLLAVANWGYPDEHGVFRSTDGGAHWQEAGAGVPPVYLKALAFSPTYATDRIAYLLTDEDKLYRSTDGGVSWALATDVPQPGSYDLVALGANRVAVATDSGVWRYQSGIQELLVNGNFEADSGWTFPATPYPGRYTDTVAYAGERVLQVGIANDTNTHAYSGAYQTVTIPAGKRAILNFHYYPVSGELTRAPLSQLLAQRQATEPVTGDLQYVLIQSADGDVIYERLLNTLSNGQGWQQVAVDLSAYAGQTIRIYFGTYNDGLGGRTALYVDDASLLVYVSHSSYLPVVFTP